MNLPPDLAGTLVSLGLAFFLGALIGAERQYRERNANLRTHVLVAIGSAQFVDLGMLLTSGDGAMRVVANVVTGVGFLGAGLILKDGTHIRGLNTAATVWCSAAVGACAGADLPAQAVVLTAAVLLANTALRPVVNAINRIPLREQESEAHYEVTVTVAPEQVPAAREAMKAALDSAHYPIAHVEAHVQGAGATMVVADLIATSVSAAELDRVVAMLKRVPGATDAAWTRSGSH
jgi:putative Mg2+ transporter-C (MgtC) family protein